MNFKESNCRNSSSTHFACDCFLERMRKLEDIAMKVMMFNATEGDNAEAFDSLIKATKKFYEVPE